MKRILPSTRRTFLKTGGVAAAALLTTGSKAATPATLPPLPANPKTRPPCPRAISARPATRSASSRSAARPRSRKPNNFDVAVPIIERALDLGVNYLDTSSIYGGPERWSEQYVGQVMKTRRNEAFLATKTKERTREGSMRMIEKSLQLLNTDHVDLWQLHDVGIHEDVDAIFAKGGAMEALIEMQQQKVVRYLGITGHYRPDALIDAVNRYPFDTILMALERRRHPHPQLHRQLLPLVVEKQMGIIGMKVPARGRLLTSWTPPPLEHSSTLGRLGDRHAPGVMTMRDAMYFTLSHPVSTVIIGCDNIAQLEENVRSPATSRPSPIAQMASLNELAAPVAQQSLFFRFTDRSKG